MDASTKRNLFALLVFYMVTDLTVTLTHKRLEDNDVVRSLQSAMSGNNLQPVVVGALAVWLTYGM